MSRVVKYVFLFGVASSIGLGYLFYRDGVATKSDIEGCEPYSFDIDIEEKELQWRTPEECLSYVVYGVEEDSLELLLLQEEDGRKKTHMVSLAELNSGIYYSTVYSGGKMYGVNGRVMTFEIP